MEPLSVVDLLKRLPTTRSMRLPLIQRCLPALSVILWPEPPPKAERLQPTGTDTFIDTRAHKIHEQQNEPQPGIELDDFGFAGSEDEVAAAARIQSLQRGKQTRREMAEQQQAATKMQAVQRGKASRKAAAGAPDLVVVSESEAVVMLDDFGFAGSEDEVSAAARIQSLQRGKQTRREMAEQQQAATKMQAVQRGKASRRNVSELAATSIVEEEEEQVEQEQEEPADPDDRFKYVAPEEEEEEPTKAGFPV